MRRAELLHSGQRITRRFLDRLVLANRMPEITSPTPGVQVSRSPNGTSIAVKTSTVSVVFATGIEGDKILAKKAVYQNGAWKFASGPAAKYRMPPQFTTEHFEKLLVVESSPTPASQVCRVDGGFIWPVYRLLLVTPPTPAQCDVG